MALSERRESRRLKGIRSRRDLGACCFLVGLALSQHDQCDESSSGVRHGTLFRLPRRRCDCGHASLGVAAQLSGRSPWTLAAAPTLHLAAEEVGGARPADGTDWLPPGRGGRPAGGGAGHQALHRNRPDSDANHISDEMLFLGVELRGVADVNVSVAGLSLSPPLLDHAGAAVGCWVAV